MRAVTAETQTWLAIRQILFDRCDDFYLQFRRAKEGFKPEAVHDLRVSSRRLREGISLFSGCFRKQQIVPVLKELKSFTKMLGTIRNCDEAIFFFEPLLEKCSAGDISIKTILSDLQDERISEKQLLQQALEEIAPARLLAGIDNLYRNTSIFNPSYPSLLKPFQETLLTAIAGSEQTICKLLPEALLEENVKAQHRLRVAIKRFRYRVEFAASFAKGDYKGIYSIIKEYQEILGQMHDLDVFRALLTDEGKIPAPVATIIAGRRTTLFNRFIHLNESAPLAKTGNLVRGMI